MASRLSSRPNSTLHQRNETRATSSIFDGYDGGSAGKRATAASNKAWQTGRSLSYGAGSSSSAAYGYHGGDYGYGYGNNGADSPLAKGQDRGRESSPYGTPVNDFGERKGRRELSREGAVQSQSVLSELEAQNDEELDGVSAKVKLLKNISVNIGNEIRSSSALAETMNDSFDSTQHRLRLTARRMLHMADRAGVGWKAWTSFFASVIFLFWYVWLS